MVAKLDPGAALRIAVVGVGALGSELCRLLMDAGHAQVLLIDPDELEDRNVALSELFGQAASLGDGPGTAKVEAVRRMAARRGLAWDSVQAEVADVGWMELSRYDLLVCCADSVLARVETAGVARSLGLPMLEGGVASDGEPRGRVACFPADQEQACYACGLSEHRRAEVLAYALSGSLGCAPGPDFRAMTGALEVLRVVAGEMFGLIRAMSDADWTSEPAFTLRLATATGLRERFTLGRSAGCPWHELPGLDQLETLPYDQPIADMLTDARGGSIELFWPVCLHARCLVCGLVVESSRRTALVRRRAACGQCGGKLEPLESVGSFRAGDEAAAWTPRQLGLPERHLYYRKPDARYEKRRAGY